MSRSHKHQYFYSWTCSGWNQGIHKDKKINNRLLRNRVKHMLRTCEDYEDLALPYRLEEVMERWSYNDDGRYHYTLEEILAHSKPYRYLRK